MSTPAQEALTFTLPDTFEAGPVIDRMKQCVRASSDSDLAAYLGVSRATLSKWRKRNSVPYAQAVFAALKTGTSMDFIFAGRGAPGDLSRSHQFALDESIVERALRFSYGLGIFKLTVEDEGLEDLWRIAHSIAYQYDRVTSIAERLQAEQQMTPEQAKLAAAAVVFEDVQWKVTLGEQPPRQPRKEPS